MNLDSTYQATLKWRHDFALLCVVRAPRVRRRPAATCCWPPRPLSAAADGDTSYILPVSGEGGHFRPGGATERLRLWCAVRWWERKLRHRDQWCIRLRGQPLVEFLSTGHGSIGTTKAAMELSVAPRGGSWQHCRKTNWNARSSGSLLEVSRHPSVLFLVRFFFLQSKYCWFSLQNSFSLQSCIDSFSFLCWIRLSFLF